MISPIEVSKFNCFVLRASTQGGIRLISRKFLGEPAIRIVSRFDNLRTRVTYRIALERSTRQVVGYAVGDRSANTAEALW